MLCSQQKIKSLQADFWGANEILLVISIRGTSYYSQIVANPESFRVSAACFVMNDASQRDGGHITPDGDARTCLETIQGVYLLDWKLMRRVLIFALVFCLFAAGLMPLSACALLSSKMAECAEAKTPSPCDQMYAPSTEMQLSGSSDKSCCVASQAPLPELQFKGVEAGPVATIAVSQDTLAVPSVRPHRTLLVVENSSPPCFQSLLCTFLI